METIKELDWNWYWLGYSMGVNSRKQIKDSPDRVVNMGKMGVITIPSELQKTSYFMGLMVGRRKIIQSLNIVQITTTIGKKGLNTADMLTLAIGKVDGIRGQYVDIPVYINKNAADNRGVAGFQLKVVYNTDYLELVNISKSVYWTGSFVSNTSTSGVILAQGVKEIAEQHDMVICYIRFLVKNTVPLNVSSIPLSIIGQAGTGTGSELLTLINNELYYITPIKLESGEVLLDAIITEPEKIGSITYPSSGTSTIGTGNSSVSYEFTANLGFPSGIGGGTGGNSGVYAYVNVYLDGVLIGQEKVNIQEGEHKYKGKIPIKLPSLDKGKITYEIVIEDETGFAYVFIKAGALFILESEVKREEAGQIELEPFNRGVIDRFWITDFVIFEKFKQSGSSPVDLTVIDEIMVITDKDTFTIHQQLNNSNSDTMMITDKVIFERYKDGKLVVDPVDITVNENIYITDILTVDMIKVQDNQSEDNMQITDNVTFERYKDGKLVVDPINIKVREKINITDSLTVTNMNIHDNQSEDNMNITDIVTFTKRK